MSLDVSGNMDISAACFILRSNVYREFNRGGSSN